MDQVGGVHFSLLSKVQYDIGDSCSLDYLIDSIFPLFRKHIEPDLHHAQVFVWISWPPKLPAEFWCDALSCRSELITALFHHLESQSTSSNAKVRFVSILYMQNHKWLIPIFSCRTCFSLKLILFPRPHSPLSLNSSLEAWQSLPLYHCGAVRFYFTTEDITFPFH